MDSREKGKGFERWVARYFRDNGFPAAQRSQQYCGANGDADVIGVPFLHIECKNRERLNLYEAMEQSVRDSKADDIPIVIYKKNRQQPQVAMRLDDFKNMFKKAYVDEIRRELYEAAGFHGWYNRRAEEEREEFYGEERDDCD